MKLKGIHINIFLIVALLLSLLSVYGNIFRNELLWDDESFIVENPDIRSLSNIPKFFANPDYGILYRPLKTTLMAVTYNVWGLNKFGYHLNSFLLHFFSTLLVFYILFELINNKLFSFLGALIFAVHPIHTERVTGVTAGFDLLGIVFYLLSFLLYIQFRKKGNLRIFAASLLSFIASLLSSEEAISLPFLILVYELIFDHQAVKDAFKRDSLKKLFSRASYYIVILSGYLIVRFLVLRHLARSSSYITGSFYSTMLTMPEVLMKYIRLLTIPINLSLNDSIPFSNSILDLGVILSLIIAAILIFYAIAQSSKNKLVSFAVFWFFITLIPFYNIIPIKSLYAERYLYLPSLSICLLFSLAFLRLKEKKQALAIFFILLLVLIFSIGTIRRNNDWQNAEALWKSTIETSPDFPAGYNNLGVEYLAQKRHDEAIPLFLKAIELKPRYAEPYNNLGIIYKANGNYSLAAYYYNKAISLKEGYYEAYYNLGILYNEVEDYDKAIIEFENALKIRPTYAKAHNNLGISLMNNGQIDEAIGEFKAALSLNPEYREAKTNLEFAYGFKKSLKTG